VVRSRAIVIAGCCCLSTLASAEPNAPELQAQGEDLAKQGRFTEAIDAFKSADKIEQTATHACLIALAYTRRELWPQAEIWLSMCQIRANPKDPLPDWASTEQDQIDQRLAAANIAPVKIVVEPADAKPKVTVSSFAPDEQFSPRTIHLPPGKHQIIVSAPGYEDAHQLLDIKDKTPQDVTIKLQRQGEGQHGGAAESNHLPRNLMIAGGAAIALGFGALGWWSYEQGQLDTASKMGNTTDYDAHSGRWDAAKWSTYGLWTVGGALAITGVVLKARHHEEVPAVTVAPLPGGGVLAVGWSR
jgi:hypothetical protein